HPELRLPAGLDRTDPVVVAVPPRLVHQERDPADLELAEAFLVRPIGQQRGAGDGPDDLPDGAPVQEERRDLERLDASVSILDVVDPHASPPLRGAQRRNCAVVFSWNGTGAGPECSWPSSAMGTEPPLSRACAASTAPENGMDRGSTTERGFPGS